MGEMFSSKIPLQHADITEDDKCSHLEDRVYQEATSKVSGSGERPSFAPSLRDTDSQDCKNPAVITRHKLRGAVDWTTFPLNQKFLASTCASLMSDHNIFSHAWINKSVKQQRKFYKQEA